MARMMVMARHVREGDEVYYLGSLRTVEKVTPRFHSVELHFQDAGSFQVGEQDYIHVEREDR